MADDLTDYPSDSHFAMAREFGNDLLKRIAGVINMLAEVDRLLGNMGMLLNISQPSTTGKIGIRWWADGHGRRVPVFVEWKQQQRGRQRFYPVKIESNIVRRQKRHSAFKVNEKPTEEMLHFAVELLRIRSVLTNTLANYSRAEIGITKMNRGTIDYQTEHLKDIGRRIRENNERWALQKEFGALD